MTPDQCVLLTRIKNKFRNKKLLLDPVLPRLKDNPEKPTKLNGSPPESLSNKLLFQHLHPLLLK
jgi:hypothetical protein